MSPTPSKIQTGQGTGSSAQALTLEDQVNDVASAQPVAESDFQFPPRQPWSSAAVKLLQGVIYHDDNSALWSDILSNISSLTDHFGLMGLQLIVDENEAMAWLHQPDADQLPEEYETLPKLFRKSTLGFEATLLAVMLREELRRNEEEDFHNQRCVVKQSDLLAQWKMFFPDGQDEVRLNKKLGEQLSKLEKYKFVKRFEKEPPSWEVRRILNISLPLSALKATRDALKAELLKRGGRRSSEALPGDDANPSLAPTTNDMGAQS